MPRNGLERKNGSHVLGCDFDFNPNGGVTADASRCGASATPANCSSSGTHVGCTRRCSVPRYEDNRLPAGRDTKKTGDQRDFGTGSFSGRSTSVAAGSTSGGCPEFTNRGCLFTHPSVPSNYTAESHYSVHGAQDEEKRALHTSNPCRLDCGTICESGPGECNIAKGGSTLRTTQYTRGTGKDQDSMRHQIAEEDRTLTSSQRGSASGSNSQHFTSLIGGDVGEISGERTVARPPTRTDDERFYTSMGAHVTSDHLRTRPFTHHLLREMEQGHRSRSSKFVHPSSKDMNLPLHIKVVRRMDWTVITNFVFQWNTNMGSMLLQSLRWLTDENFLEEKAQSEPDCLTLGTPAAMRCEDILLLLHHQLIREVKKDAIRCWCTVFTVAETAKSRRRLITEPLLNRSKDKCGAFVDCHLVTIEEAILAVHTETAFVSDFPWYYGQMPLALEAQKFYGFHHIDTAGNSRYYVLTTAPTGSRHVPHIAQIISKAIAGSARSRALQDVHEGCLVEGTEDVYLDILRLAGSSPTSLRAMHHYRIICCELGISINSKECMVATKYTFLGIDYDHIKKSVTISNKTRSKLEEMLHGQNEWQDRMQLQQVVAYFGLLVYCSRIYSLVTSRYYHLYKMLRKKMGCDMNMEIVVWNIAQTQARMWTKDILDCGPMIPALALEIVHDTVLFTDAAPKGWGAVVFRGPKIHSLAGRFICDEHINILEARAALYGLQFAFDLSQTSTHIKLFVDNECLRFSLQKTRSRNFTINKILTDIFSLLQHHATLGSSVSVGRVASALNHADILTRLDT